jgi:hypothetical protein
MQTYAYTQRLICRLNCEQVNDIKNEVLIVSFNMTIAAQVSHLHLVRLQITNNHLTNSSHCDVSEFDRAMTMHHSKVKS